MTRERYFQICEQLGEEPDEEKIPPDWQDFPEIIVVALNTFNMLGDRVVAEVGFIGKDYTALPYFIDMYGIEPEEKELFIETLNIDEMVAQLLVSEGFATLEEVAFVQQDEISSIDGFDTNTAEELQARAKECLDEINAKALASAKTLAIFKIF